jgi:hypothetical protein
MVMTSKESIIITNLALSFTEETFRFEQNQYSNYTTARTGKQGVCPLLWDSLYCMPGKSKKPGYADNTTSIIPDSIYAKSN